MDAIGGVFNAFTSKEHTCYYAKILDEDLPLAIDLLTDIFLHSDFDGEEIERERSVILQEISQAEDTPDDYIHDLFSLDFFKDHPLARPICGSAETVNSFRRQDFLTFFKSRYRPRACRCCGGRPFASRRSWFRRSTKGWVLWATPSTTAAQSSEDDAGAPEMQSGIFQHTKSLEQVHLCLGVSGVHQTHPQRYTAYVLNTLLGGGMSSRLFQEIREKRGKAYSVYSFSSPYKDVGYVGVYAGTSVEWVEEVVELILKELKQLAAGDIKDEEIRRTQGQLVGSMMLGLESTDSWMSHIARNEIYFGEPITTDEICQGVRAVSRDAVVDLASTLFGSQGIALSLLGDFKNDIKIKI